jgi:hypothetical protein
MAERPTPSTRPVLQKLLLKPGSRALVLSAPPGYLDQFNQFPGDVKVEQQLGEGPFDFIQLFAIRRDELVSAGPEVRDALKPNGLLWVSYPKSRALATDLNRDIVAAVLVGIGLQPVTQVAIDDTWSALRAKIV